MKTILLFSGGLDSTTLLYQLLSERHEVVCLGVNYGQRHLRELIAAHEIAKEVGVEIHEVKLPKIWQKSALVGGQPLLPGDQAGNIVPNRNMMMISLATTYALEHGADSVAWGPNRDDWGIFPDCREQFANAMRDSMSYCHTRPISLITPLISLTKAQVVSLAFSLKVPTGATWSCYEGGRKPCRKCGACLTREKAFFDHALASS